MTQTFPMPCLSSSLGRCIPGPSRCSYHTMGFPLLNGLQLVIHHHQFFFFNFFFFLPPAVVILGGGGSGGRSNGRFPGSPWCSRPSLVLLLQHWHVPRTRQNPRARFCMREGLLLAGHGFCRLKRPKPRRVPLCVLLGIVPSCRDGVLLAEVGLRLGCMDFSELSLSMDDSPVWACLLG